MMKYFVLLFLTSFCFSQNYQSIKVEYTSVLEPFLKENHSDEKYNELTRKINESLNNKKFVLEANTQGFLFNEVSTITIEKSEKQLKIEKLANGIYRIYPFYYSTTSLELLKILDDVSLKMDTSFKWEITNESKQIDNYICYKAICNISFKTRNGNEGTRLVTAWFTPEINFNYGPNGYIGLPGLILELEDNKTKLVAKKIEFYKENIKIDFPKTKTVTEEEFLSRIGF